MTNDSGAPVCMKWILYCGKVIETFSRGELDEDSISCSTREYFANRTCPDIVYYGKDRTGREEQGTIITPALRTMKGMQIKLMKPIWWLVFRSFPH